MEIIIVPKVLRDKLSEEGADALIQLINKTNEKVKEDVIVIVEEKFERRLTEELGKIRVEMANLEGRLRAEMGNLEGRLRTEIANLRVEIADARTEMANLEGRLRAEIAETKSTLIKWMFIFWVTQFIAIMGILIKVMLK